MASKENSKTISGIEILCILLGVAFIILKLVGVIEWSWVWVLSPLWIPLAICIIVLIVVAILSLIDYFTE